MGLCLVQNYLKVRGYEATLSVFYPETRLNASDELGTQELCTLLGM